MNANPNVSTVFCGDCLLTPAFNSANCWFGLTLVPARANAAIPGFVHVRLQMARPRVFVSSTYYDLKHLRSALEGFIESLGFEPVLSEKGSVPYSPDIPLDESCYREVEQADLMVLIVGGRYGSATSESKKAPSEDSIAMYNSITRREFKTAIESNIPLYVLIERSVYAEHMTFDKNRTQKKIKYAHVNHVGIFQMLDEVIALPKNNPVFPFERYHEIEDWLREQWAGLFRDLLRRRSSQEQLTTLAIQVSQLNESNLTLQRYIESLMKRENQQSSAAIIDAEKKRLENSAALRLRKMPVMSKFKLAGISPEELLDALRNSTTLADFAHRIKGFADCPVRLVRSELRLFTEERGYIIGAQVVNMMRAMFDLPPFDDSSDPDSEANPLSP